MTTGVFKVIVFQTQSFREDTGITCSVTNVPGFRVEDEDVYVPPLNTTTLHAVR